MSPSHAVKSARRYRYYITHAADREDGDQPAWRLAAHDVESVVISRLRELPESRSTLLSLAGDQASGAAAASALLTAATHLVRKLDDPQQRRDLVRAVVSEVVVANDHIALHVSPSHLLEQLGASGDAAGSADHPLTLVVPYHKIRKGKEVRLIISSEQAVQANADGLLKLIAEAQATCDAVLAAPEKSIRDFAEETNRCRTRVAQLIRIATLAPDIVQRCLESTQPPTLTARKLLSIDLPIAWDKQRAMLDIR